MIEWIQALRLDDFKFLVSVYAVCLSLIGAIAATRKVSRLWRTRHLRKVWGFKDGDPVVVVCSELDEADSRQNVEPREFIYNLKYGDLDALFEVVTTLLRLYSRLRLRVLSSGEAEKIRLDTSGHVVLIGGPDYNALTRNVLAGSEAPRIEYRSPHDGIRSELNPDEITLVDRKSAREYFEASEMKDYGYFERIENPFCHGRFLLLVGGCHTIGVTGAAKAFSLADSEQGEIPATVLNNASTVARSLSESKEFTVLLRVSRIGQTVSTPVVDDSTVWARPPKDLSVDYEWKERPDSARGAASDVQR